MRHPGLFAFGLTTAILVPTVVHLLDAGPDQVAKLVAPGTKTLTFGKARVEVAADRAFVDAGGQVHVTFTATSETPQRITLALLLLESQGSGGGRVELPPEVVRRETVNLDIKGGQATRTMTFKLSGYRGSDMGGVAAFGHYTFLVMPPKDAVAFERLRRKAKKTDFDSAFQEAYYQAGLPVERDEHGEPTSPTFGTEGQIARLDVNTRPTDSPVSIEAPTSAHPGEPLAIKVRIHNKSKRSFGKVVLSLSTKPYEVGEAYLGIDQEQTKVAEEELVVAVGPRQTQEVVFHVTATATGTLGLFAQARCNDECPGGAAATLLDDAALDAIDVVAVDQAPAAVAVAPADGTK